VKKITVLFYKSESGNRPVREFILSLNHEDKQIISNDLKTVEYAWPIGMPTCKKLEKELYEVRSSLSDKKIARVLFTVIDEYMILLSAFIKKSQKTPKKELELARSRKKEIT